MSAGAIPVNVPAARRLRIGRRLGLWLLVLLALIGLGVGTWIYQFANGLVVTGLTNLVMWGQYILFFMFFVGLSAGGLIVASAGRLFGATIFKPIVRRRRARGNGRDHPRGDVHPPRPRPPGSRPEHPASRQPDVADDLGHRDRLRVHGPVGQVRVAVHASATWRRAGAGWRSGPPPRRRPRLATSAGSAGSRGLPCRRRSCSTRSPRGSSASRSAGASGTRRSWPRCSSARPSCRAWAW